MTRLTAAGSRICLLAEARDLPLLKSVQTIFWAHPPSYSVGTGPNQLRHEAKHSLPPSAGELYRHFPYLPLWHIQGKPNITLPLLKSFITNKLWRTILCNKLTLALLVKNFSAFYRTGKVITIILSSTPIQTPNLFPYDQF